MDERTEKIKEKLSAQLSGMRDVGDEELFALIDKEIEEAENEYYLPVSTKINMRTSLYNSFRKLDILQELLDRKDITEIMINGHDEIFVERNGMMERCDMSFESDSHLEDVIQ